MILNAGNNFFSTRCILYIYLFIYFFTFIYIDNVRLHSLSAAEEKIGQEEMSQSQSSRLYARTYIVPRPSCKHSDSIWTFKSYLKVKTRKIVTFSKLSGKLMTAAAPPMIGFCNIRPLRFASRRSHCSQHGDHVLSKVRPFKKH
jgi:hypothetical protein